MLCPYCLEDVKPQFSDKDRSAKYMCPNKECRKVIPNEYVKNKKIGKVIVNAVGFSRHGKTVYFASLFYLFNQMAEHWNGFATLSVDENSLQTVKHNIKMIDKEGLLPNPTQKNFPLPTIIRFSNLPIGDDRFFLFYDTGGESYRRAQNMVKFAGFVKNSLIINFFVSLDDLDNPRDQLHELLQIYIQGLIDLGGDSTRQHLIVVLTKGDKLKEMLGEKSMDIWESLMNSKIEDLDKSTVFFYLARLRNLSARIEEFFQDELKAHQFLNLAHTRFKSVEFCLLSSLGSPPASDGRTLQTRINPKRVIDPLVWIMFKNQPEWYQTLFDWYQKAYSFFNRGKI